MVLRAFVLKKIKTNESDLVVHLLTQTGLKFSAIAKGALRSKKRFAGVLEPTFMLDVLIKKMPSDDRMAFLDEAKLVNEFLALRSDYDRIGLALKIVDAVGVAASEGNERLFDLLEQTLTALCLSKNLSTFWIQFVLKFFYQQGVLQEKPWMSEFLRTSVHDNHKIANYHWDEIENYHAWASLELQNYLQRAERVSGTF